jgi:hypothetical protein
MVLHYIENNDKYVHGDLNIESLNSTKAGKFFIS